MAGLPTAEELLGPAPKEPTAPNTKLPTAEELLGPPPDNSKASSQTGPVNDAFWSWQGNKMGRIISAIGQGAEQGWGAGVEFAKKGEELLKEAATATGVYLDPKAHNDMILNKQQILKAGNEAWTRTSLHDIYGSTNPVGPTNAEGLVAGPLAALTAITAPIAQTGTEMINTAKSIDEDTDFERYPYGKPEAKILGEAGDIFKAVGLGQYLPLPELIPPTILQARAAGAIGESLPSFFGLREPTFDEWQGRLRAIAEEPGPAGQAAKTDIHEMAKLVAPDTFQRWSTLEDHKQLLTDHLSGLQTLKAKDETVTKLEAKIERLAKKTEGPATPLNREDREALEKAKADLQAYHDTDSQDILDAKAALSRVNQERRELAPDVKKAYQEAQARINPYELPRSSVTEEGSVPEGSVPPEAAKVSPIFQSVYDQVKAAGRPEEEAKATAAMVQARYETRAKRFGGKLGTAEELYNKDRLSITKEEGQPGEGTVFNQDEIEKLNNVTNLEDYKYKKSIDKAIEQGVFPDLNKIPDYQAQLLDIKSSIADVLKTSREEKLFGIYEKWKEWSLFVHKHNEDIFSNDPKIISDYNQLKREAFDILDRFKANSKKPGENVIQLPGKEVNALKVAKNEAWEDYNRFSEKMDELQDEIIELKKSGLKDADEHTQLLYHKLLTDFSEAAENAKKAKAVYDAKQAEFVKALESTEKTLEQSKFIKSYDETIKLFKERFDELQNKWLEEGQKSRDLQEKYEELADKGSDEELKRANEERIIQDKKENEAFEAWKDAMRDLDQAEANLKRKDPLKDITNIDTWKVIEDIKERRNKSESTYLGWREGSRDLFNKMEKFRRDHPSDWHNSKEFAEIENQWRRVMDKRNDAYKIFEEDRKAYIDALENKPFFQEGARANISFQKDGQSIIRLFKDADASSVFHELGHKWLEELKVDAEHPEAPEQLKKDWATVREFYGIKKKITETQHENWARGFERYLMEGIAPSKQLESVFKQLKDWLIQIYKQVTALRAPINDDIRAVMDRLLASDEDAVITGDTSPRLPSAKTKVIKESAAVKPGEGDVSPEGSPKLGTSTLLGGKTYLQDNGEFNLEDLGSYADIDAGIKKYAELNEAAISLRGGKLTRPDIVNVAQTMAMRPKVLQANVEKLESITTGDKYSLVHRILALNEMLKQSAAKIKAVLEKENPTPKEMAKFAGQVTLHKKLIETMLGIRGEWGRAGHAFQIMLEEALTEGDAVFNQSLLQSIGISMNQLGRRMKLFRGVSTPQQVSNMATKLTNPSLGKSLVQYYINGLISGPFTHIQYALGNEMTTVKQELVEPGISAAVGSVRAAMGNTGPRIEWDEMVARTHAMHYGSRDGLIAAVKAMKEGYQQGFDSDDLILGKVLHEIKTGKITSADKQRRITELTNKVTAFNRLHDVADIKKDEERALNNIVRAQKGLKPIAPRIDPDLNEVFSIIERAEPPQSFYTESREQIAARGPFGSNVPGTIQHLINSPGERMVSPIHTVNYIQNLTINLYGRINRAAFAEGQAKGWTQQQVTQRITEMRIDPPLEMIRAAREDALTGALLSKPGAFIAKYNMALSHEFNVPGLGLTPYLKIPQPFVTINQLLWKFGAFQLGYGIPGGFLANKRIRADFLGRNGKLAQDLTIGKVIVGHTLFAAFWALAAEGAINPGPPDTAQAAAVQRMRSGLPYGLRLGDMTYDFEKLGPLGWMASIVSDMYHFSNNVLHEKYAEAAKELVYQLGHHATQTGFMSGVADLFQAMSNPLTDGPEYANQLMAAFATPFSVGSAQIAHEYDPYERQIRSGGGNYTPGMSGKDIALTALLNEWSRLKKQWAKNIPIESTSLYPVRDLFGQPMPSKKFIGVYYEKIKQDPVFNALDKLGFFPAQVPYKIGDYTMSEEMYDKMTARAGEMAHRLMLQSVSNPNWSKMPPGIQHKILAQDISAARKQARGTIEAEYKDVAKTNAEFKIAITKPLPNEEPEEETQPLEDRTTSGEGLEEAATGEGPRETSDIKPMKHSEPYPSIQDALHSMSTQDFPDEQKWQELMKTGKTVDITNMRGKTDTIEKIIQSRLPEILPSDKTPSSKVAEHITKAFVASRRNWISTLGFKPDRFGYERNDQDRFSLGGEYDSEKDTGFSMLANPESLVHESIHRGLKLLQDSGKLTDQERRFVTLHHEDIPRYIVAKDMGDPQLNIGPIGQKQREEALTEFEKRTYGEENRQLLTSVEHKAAELFREQVKGTFPTVPKSTKKGKK